MVKRRTNVPDDYYTEGEDNPIGLTSAFAPVKGRQSVEYDADDDPVGLTQAFGAVVPEEEPEYGWQDDKKWKGFDWNADYQPADDVQPSADAGASDDSAQTPEPVDNQVAEQPDVQPAGEQGAAVPMGAPATTPKPASSGSSGKRGRHAAPDPMNTPRMRKSRRTRRVLIVLIVLLILGLAGLGVYMFRTFTATQEQATQETQERAAAPKDEIDKPTEDATEVAAKLTDVPVLTTVLGKNQDEALQEIGHGATVSNTSEAADADDEDVKIKKTVTVTLADEPVDSKTGSPTVYLGLDEDGKVIEVGYSASATALGFGSLSFADAVNNEHAIEKTLGRIGVEVPEGSAVLPSDSKEYTTYATDGSTVVKERCSFSGETEVDGTPCTWSSVLSYDYTTQVLTGNLSDTVRVVYSYVTTGN